LKYIQQIWAILKKDMIAEFHSREILSAMLVFAALALLIFSFALDVPQIKGAGATGAANFAPGILWTTIAFTGTLGLNRSMAREQRAGSIEGLRLAPIDRTVIFFGKALGNLALMLIVELALLPLGSVLFDVMLLSGDIALIMLLGTIGYAAVGTLLATMAVNTRAREVMLPILLLPVSIPLLIAAVRATQGVMERAALTTAVNAEIPLHPSPHWIRLLIVYDLIIIAVSMLTFEYIVEEI
jgi:heme exporter protein B